MSRPGRTGILFLGTFSWGKKKGGNGDQTDGLAGIVNLNRMFQTASRSVFT